MPNSELQHGLTHLDNTCTSSNLLTNPPIEERPPLRHQKEPYVVDTLRYLQIVQTTRLCITCYYYGTYIRYPIPLSISLFSSLCLPPSSACRCLEETKTSVLSSFLVFWYLDFSHMSFICIDGFHLPSPYVPREIMFRISSQSG